MTRILFYITVLLLFILQPVTGQSDEAAPTFVNAASTNFIIGMGYDVPMGDLADRFGSSLSFKLAVERQTTSDWIYGGQLDYQFGTTVKEDVLAHVRLSNGNILGGNQSYANIFQRQRGLFIGGTIGRFVRMSDQYKSGLKVSLSAGVYQHFIRIIDDLRSFSQLNDPYDKGYDRLTRGLGLKQFVGWQYLSEDNRVNFYIGLEFTQAFTKSVRDYNFDTGQLADKSGRFDGLISLKAGWVFPWYSGYEDTEIFY